jgi:ribosomal protein S15P/S13E
MSSQFKITTWAGSGNMQIRTAVTALFLDAEDVQKLREHFKNEKKDAAK